MNEPARIDAKTSGAVAQALAAARTGQIAAACRIARDALDSGGDPIALNALLGMMHCRSGDLAAGIAHLRVAHQGNPADVTIACNLIAALLGAGLEAEALEIAGREVAFADATLRLGRYRGFLCQQFERFDEAIEAYEFVVANAPSDWESWNNLGNARRATGDHDGSVAALRKSVALNPDAPPSRVNLASALAAQGNSDEAEQVLRTAAEDFPDDAKPLSDLYILLKLQERHAEAFPILEQAISRDPDDAGLQLKWGIECGVVRRIADAEKAFRRAVVLNPKLTDAYLGLAVQFEHTNREEEFAPLLAEATAAGVDAGVLAFIRTFDCRRRGEFEEALQLIDQVPADVEPERMAHTRATLLDRLGRSNEAFDWFSRANRLHAAHPSDPLARAAELRAQLRQESEVLTPAWRDTWTAASPPPSRRADPVFLVGFPRSGTTLLDTLLMGHPDVCVMEEQPPLHIVDHELGGLQVLPALDEEQIGKARDRYFEEVEKIVGGGWNGLLVDKAPLSMNKVPLIHRLFPRARFILALRHPCDVILSAFMSNFSLNQAMSNFLRLEDAAEFYDLNFRHWDAATALFPVASHSIVYERMIEDLESVLRPTFDFLGLDWRDEVLDHRRTARSRGFITTASYSQVTEPIYKRAAGRWVRYREHLEPVLPVLRPWVEKFGYSLDG